MKKQILKMFWVVLVASVGLTLSGGAKAKSGSATWIHAAKVRAVLKIKADPQFVAHFSYEGLEFIASQGEKGIEAVLAANDLILDTFMTADEITQEAMFGLGFKGKDHFKMSVILTKACQERIAELDMGVADGNPPVPDIRPKDLISGNPPVPDI